MPESPIAPLLLASEKEKTRTWEDLGTPSRLADWFQKMFAVDLSSFIDIVDFYIGTNEPEGTQRGKVHFKTSRPYGIGFLVGGSYEYIYQWQRNTPFRYIATSVTDIPSELTQLTAEQISAYGLSTDGSGYFWCIFNV